MYSFACNDYSPSCWVVQQALLTTPTFCFTNACAALIKFKQQMFDVMQGDFDAEIKNDFDIAA